MQFEYTDGCNEDFVELCHGLDNFFNELVGGEEDLARKKGYKYLILESGEPLVAAMALYRKIGYEVIPNYGQYKDMKDSICMRKAL